MLEEVSFEHLHPGMPAMTLADEFLEMMGGKHPKDVEITRTAVLLAAQHLADTTGPLTWPRFGAAGFFRKIEFMSSHEQIGIGLALLGFYGWMVFAGLVPADPGLTIIEEITRAAPESPILVRLCEQSLESIEHLLPN